jgi:hypothetical protein
VRCDRRKPVKSIQWIDLSIERRASLASLEEGQAFLGSLALRQEKLSQLGRAAGGLFDRRVRRSCPDGQKSSAGRAADAARLGQRQGNKCPETA